MNQDEYLNHECADRAYTVLTMLRELLENHPGLRNGSCQNLYDNAEMFLHQLYQEAGRAHMTDAPTIFSFELWMDYILLNRDDLEGVWVCQDCDGGTVWKPCSSPDCKKMGVDCDYCEGTKRVGTICLECGGSAFLHSGDLPKDWQPCEKDFELQNEVDLKRWKASCGA